MTAEYPRTMDLAHWINERESIRLRREEGIKAPWTADPAMANVRYCNVHREDDKVTRYIRGSGIYSGADVEPWVVVLARMVNRITTLEAIKAPVEAGDLAGVSKVLKSIRETGAPIWGNAYTISTCGKAMDKVDYVLNWVVQAVMEAGGANLEMEGSTLRAVFEKLTCVDGLGSFLAAQVVADFKNTPGHPLQQAPDWWTWAAHGPGSLKGITAYFGHPVTAGGFTKALSKATGQVEPFLNNYVGRLHAQDMQNCFCEFSKYIRVREGGRARNNYDPSN